MKEKKSTLFKAHDKAMERRKRSTSNAALAPELVWRIKQLIIEEKNSGHRDKYRVY